MSLRSVALVCALAAVSACGWWADVPNEPVQVSGGRVSGVVLDDVRVFKGIPYAAPPVGDLRWRAPRPVIPWTDVRDGSAYGAECPQAPAISIYPLPERQQSEDCLFLDVWTPIRAAAPLPVLVWIHGGDLTKGSSSSDFPSGIPMARRGIVVVSINYRLGALGYLAHPELSAESERGVSGNYGLLDQIAALEWVRDNVAAFGGDPGRVTIAGQSGGASSVSALMASPLAEGLFARAIGQSGGWLGPGVFLKENSDGHASAEEAGVAFTRELLGGTPDTALWALRSAPTDALLRPRFRPRETVDGWVLPDEIRTTFFEKRHHDVPVILGSTADEATVLVDAGDVPATLDGYRAWIDTQFEGAAPAFEAAYGVTSGTDAAPAMLAATRDLLFTLPIRTWARLVTDAGSPAYLYLFDHRPPVAGRDDLGAFHGAEVPYVFDVLLAGEPGASAFGYTSADHMLAERMSTYWANFVSSGNPNSAGLPVWRPYDRQTEPYMRLGETIAPGEHLFKSQLDFLEGLTATR